MLKSILLVAITLTACAVEESTQESATGTCGHDCPCTHDCPTDPGPSCEVNGETVFLDEEPANVDDSDRKVTYCHATSASKNKFVLITTSVRACRAHVAHEHQEKGGHLDVFGSDGCED